MADRAILFDLAAFQGGEPLCQFREAFVPVFTGLRSANAAGAVGKLKHGLLQLRDLGIAFGQQVFNLSQINPGRRR